MLKLTSTGLDNVIFIKWKITNKWVFAPSIVRIIFLESCFPGTLTERLLLQVSFQQRLETLEELHKLTDCHNILHVGLLQMRWCSDALREFVVKAQLYWCNLSPQMFIFAHCNDYIFM